MQDNLVQLNADGSYPTSVTANKTGQYPKVGVTAGHRLQVEAVVTNPSPTDETAATVTSGTKTVTTAGTAVLLSATSSKVDGIIIVPLRTNTGQVYIGTDGTGTAQHMQCPITIIAPSGSYIDLNTLYVNSTVSGEGVYFYGLS
jgi:hypothetical protein